MASKCIEPAQQSGRGRTESYNRTTDRQSHHASSSGSHGDAHDALAVVLHQGPRTSRTPHGADNTSREFGMSRTHRESRGGTTNTGRDSETSRNHRDSRTSRATNSSSRDLEPSRSHRPSRGPELELIPRERDGRRRDARDEGRRESRRDSSSCERIEVVNTEDTDRMSHGDHFNSIQAFAERVNNLTTHGRERTRREGRREVRRANAEDYPTAEAFLLSLSPDEPGHCCNRSCSCGNILFTDLVPFLRAHPDFPYPNRT